MATKQAIIDNVAEYTPAQLAEYIRNGIVSFDELCEEPEFSAVARKEVKNLLTGSEDDDWQNAVARNTIEDYDRYLQNYPEGKHRSEAREAKKRLADIHSNKETENEWQNLDKGNVEALKEFVRAHPDSPHVSEANDIIKMMSRRRYSTSALNRLKQEIEDENDPEVIVSTIKNYISNGSITSDQLYAEMQSNHNLVTSKVIDRLEQEGVIDFVDLETYVGINPKFLEFITNNDVNRSVINIDSTPIDYIGPKTTEVYFWGIPASGKTCALGAIMNETRHGDYVEFAEPNINCQGYHYMTVLSQVFEGGTEVFKLPEGTQTDAIFEMSYVFKRQKKDYPVTFIDLAGETIESMYRISGNLPLSAKKQNGLDMACNLLRGNSGINRKIHFFVLEYNGHNKKYQGLTQDTLLTGAMTFIKTTGIFKTETDAIYLLVTKSDLTGVKSDIERNRILADYIKTYYRQFYNGLCKLCEENEINDGKVDIVPFSLGDVCFQNLCLFDNATAKVVVELIMNRAKGFKSGKMANFLNKFKK